jgi:hypothetical protein
MREDETIRTSGEWASSSWWRKESQKSKEKKSRSVILESLDSK